MSIIKQLKSLFVVEENPESQAGHTAATPTTQGPPEGGGRKEEAMPVTAPGKLNDQFLDILVKALERANKEGIDYLDFRNSLKSLEKLSMDEKTRFQSAFAMAQALGASPQGLADSATHYIRVLEEEQRKFQETIEKQRAIQIEDKGRRVETLGRQIQERQQQIQSLQQQIEADLNEQNRLKAEVVNAAQIIENRRQEFEASYRFVSSQIQSDVENIGKYLK